MCVYVSVLAKNLQLFWDSNQRAPMKAHQRDNWYGYRRSENDLKNEDDLENEDYLKIGRRPKRLKTTSKIGLPPKSFCPPPFQVT